MVASLKRWRCANNNESATPQPVLLTATINPGQIPGAKVRRGRAQVPSVAATGNLAADAAPRAALDVRQLRDWKYFLDIDAMKPPGMHVYGELCGWTLARAHARSGDAVAIAAYLGGADVFDQAIADFAVGYADQSERDYQALATAAATGRIIAHSGL